jgi:hypothetical protein
LVVLDLFILRNGIPRISRTVHKKCFYFPGHGGGNCTHYTPDASLLFQTHAANEMQGESGRKPGKYYRHILRPEFTPILLL